MSISRTHVRFAGALALAVLALPVARVEAQERPPSPVRFTLTREYPVRQTVKLPGTVLSRTYAQAATEVEGMVVELPAREGDSVKKGQPLAVLRKTRLELQLAAAQAQLKEAEARLEQAERALERAKGLRQSDLASEAQYDQAVADETAGEGRVEDLKAQIELIRLGIELCTIRAPFDAAVVAERTEVGQWLRVGDPVVELVSLDDLDVRVEITERYYPLLEKQDAATIRFDALPGMEFQGKVRAVVPAADLKSRVFPILVKIQNPSRKVAVGMLAEVALPLGEPAKAVIAPKDAVVSQGPGRVVYPIAEDGGVAPLPVTLGSAVGDWVVIQGEGVKPGMKVVTRGNERLFPGMKVAGEPLEYALP